jgi:hypothetical protein
MLMPVGVTTGTFEQPSGIPMEFYDGRLDMAFGDQRVSNFKIRVSIRNDSVKSMALPLLRLKG